MTAELGPTSRALLSAARHGLAPDADVAARVRDRISVAIGGAGGAAVGAGAGGRALSWKLAAVIGAALAISAGTLAYRGDRGRVPDALTVLPEDRTEELVMPEIRLAMTDGQAAVEVPEAVHARAVVHRPAATAASPAEPTLAREVEVMDRAMSSLRAGDPSAALAAIALYRRETRGHGQLAEDADAIEIEALCRSHVDLGERLDDFDRRWPKSAQRARLSAACTHR